MVWCDSCHETAAINCAPILASLTYCSECQGPGTRDENQINRKGGGAPFLGTVKRFSFSSNFHKITPASFKIMTFSKRDITTGNIQY